MIYREYIIELEDKFTAYKRKYIQYYSFIVIIFFSLLFLTVYLLQSRGQDLLDNYFVKAALFLVTAGGLMGHMIFRRRFFRSNRHFLRFIAGDFADFCRSCTIERGDGYDGLSLAFKKILAERGIDEERVDRDVFLFNLSLFLKERK